MTPVSNDISDAPWAQRVYPMWLARDTRYALAALNALIACAQNTPVPPAAWVCFGLPRPTAAEWQVGTSPRSRLLPCASST